MKKYVIALFMIGVLSLGILGVSFAGNPSGPPYAKVVVAIPLFGVPQEDVAMVQEKINEITEKEIGVTVEFPEFSNSPDYFPEAILTLSTPEQLDIMLAGYGCFMECYVDGKLRPLDSLLEEYGQDIIQQVGEDRIRYCDIHGVHYGIPVNGDYTQQRNCYVMRKDILEKYHLDPKKIRTIEDLEHVFAVVKEKEPGMTVLSAGAEPNTTILTTNLSFLDTSSGISLTAYEGNGKEGRLINAFDSEEYKNALRQVRRWYLKGYIDEDIYGVKEPVDSRVRQGELFAYTERKAAWSEKSEDIRIGGIEMVRVSPGPAAFPHRGYSSMPYVITRNSVSPKAAMQLLNLFYSNSEIEDLLCYGVEGVHYKKTEDGHITYIEEGASNPFLWNSYNIPNQYITHVWEGQDLDFWKQVEKRNESVRQGPKMGFNFDYSNVAAEYRKVTNIYLEYKWILENGIDNPEEGQRKMISEMEGSGLNLVIQEEQKQFEAWQERNSKGAGN